MSEPGEILQAAMERIAKRLAKDMTVLCVRHTGLEDLHAGIFPDSKTGDYDDVKVVTPYGEIPWNNVSRISDDEMRAFMKQVVDRLYTVLLRLDDTQFLERMGKYGQRLTYGWDEPTHLADWFVDK